jgi:two-component system sensor histidine kinase KdpD
VLQRGRAALREAFDGGSIVALADDGVLQMPADLDASTRDGLRACMREAAVLGPGTARWPGLDAWYLPLGDKGRIVGAACVRPAVAADIDAREHALALCALMAQALWRLRLSADMLKRRVPASAISCRRPCSPPCPHDLRTPLAAIVGAASVAAIAARAARAGPSRTGCSRASPARRRTSRASPKTPCSSCA